jgi:hypothetical protein
MKATLTFDLPEEKHEHGLAANADVLAGALLEIERMIRDHRKYASPPDAETVFESIRTEISQLYDILN